MEARQCTMTVVEGERSNCTRGRVSKSLNRSPCFAGKRRHDCHIGFASATNWTYPNRAEGAPEMVSPVPW